MVEITIHARGGQGGVTLAKLIAEAYFLKGKYTQAFGVYAAERSGAPLQAYVRIDDEEITNANQVREPDHVIVLDRTLIGPRVVAGLKPDGWVILNTPSAPDSFAEIFPGLRSRPSMRPASPWRMGSGRGPFRSSTRRCSELSLTCSGCRSTTCGTRSPS